MNIQFFKTSLQKYGKLSKVHIFKYMTFVPFAITLFSKEGVLYIFVPPGNIQKYIEYVPL